MEELGLSEHDTTVLTDTVEMARFFDKTIELTTNAKAAANWIIGDISAYLKENKINLEDTKLTPEALAEMIDMVDKGTITNAIAKKLVINLLEKGGSARKMVEEQGLSVISNENEILDIVKKVIAANANEVEKYKAGKTQVIGFFVGQVMKETRGKADPAIVNRLFKDELEK